VRGTPVPSTLGLVLAAIVGSWAVLGSASDAEAAFCHAPDRPVFGLSDDHRASPLPGTPSTPPPDIAVEDEEGVRVLPRSCPDDSPDGPSRRVAVERAVAIAPPIVPPGDETGRLVSSGRPPRPILRRDRIDRPPRA